MGLLVQIAGWIAIVCGVLNAVDVLVRNSAIVMASAAVLWTGGFICVALGSLINRLDGAAKVGDRFWARAKAQDAEAARAADAEKLAEAAVRRAVSPAE